MANEIEKNNGEIIIYQSEDGKIRLDVRLEEKTVWLSQEQIAQLYGKGRSTITEHISNVFKEGELEKEKVCRKFRHTTQHRPMYMEDYVQQLDNILSANGEELLEGAGTVSHEEAMYKALAEYRKFQVKTLSPVEQA